MCFVENRRKLENLKENKKIIVIIKKLVVTRAQDSTVELQESSTTVPAGWNLIK